MMQIRKATTADLEAILEIENNSFDAERFNRRQLRYLITKARGLFLVLEQEERIAAYICMIRHSGHNNLRIYSIAVHPAYRGQKLGRLLVEQSVEYARQLQLSVISLEVNTENNTAIALYTQTGFIIKERLKRYYTNGGNALRMVKNLHALPENSTISDQEGIVT